MPGLSLPKSVRPPLVSRSPFSRPLHHQLLSQPLDSCLLLFPSVCHLPPARSDVATRAATSGPPTTPAQTVGHDSLKVAHQHEQLVVRNAEMERSRQVRNNVPGVVVAAHGRDIPGNDRIEAVCTMADFMNCASQVMAAEKDRDIASMTMARQVEETEADLRIHRIQGGRNGLGTYLRRRRGGSSWKRKDDFVCLKQVNAHWRGSVNCSSSDVRRRFIEGLGYLPARSPDVIMVCGSIYSKERIAKKGWE